MRWVPPISWSALFGLWVRLVALKVLVWRFVPCYPVHEILNRTGSSVLVWEESLARRVQRSPKPISFSTEQVNLMSLKLRRDRHHKNLTTDWTGRKQTMCCHPSYKGQRKGKTQTRRVSGLMSQGIFELHNAVVPIGSSSFYVNWLTAY